MQTISARPSRSRSQDSAYQTASWRDGTLFIEGRLLSLGAAKGRHALPALIQQLNAQGPQVLAQAQGDFVALITTADEIYAFKSFTSQYQLYYRPEDGLVSNRLHTFWEPDLVWDQTYFFKHVLGTPGYQSISVQTPLAGVQRVLPGEMVTLSHSRIKREQCTQRQYRYNLDAQQTHASASGPILDVLRDSIQTQIEAAPDTNWFIDVSEGLNAIFLAQLFHEQAGDKVQTVVLTQAEQSESTPQLQLAHQAAQHFGLSLSIVQAPKHRATNSGASSPAQTLYSEEPTQTFWRATSPAHTLSQHIPAGASIVTTHGIQGLFARSTAFLPYLLKHGQFLAWHKAVNQVSELLSRGPLNLSWQCLLSQMPNTWQRRLNHPDARTQRKVFGTRDIDQQATHTQHMTWLKARDCAPLYNDEYQQAKKLLFGADILNCDWAQLSAMRLQAETSFGARHQTQVMPFCQLPVMDHLYQQVNAKLVHDFEAPDQALLRAVQARVLPNKLIQSHSNATFDFQQQQTRLRTDERHQYEAFSALLRQANPDWVDLKSARQSLESLLFGVNNRNTQGVMSLLSYLQWQQMFNSQAPRLQRQADDHCRIYRSGGLNGCEDCRPSLRA